MLKRASVTTTFCLAFMGTLAFIAIISPTWLIPSAMADIDEPPCFGPPGDHGTVGADEGYGTGSFATSRATRSDMYIEHDGAFCQRVASIYVRTADLTGGFEVGWLVGYSECPSDGTQYQFMYAPTFFYWAVKAHGVFKTCKMFTDVTLDPGEYQLFATSD